MPLSERNWRGDHPPACTCVECTKKRLARTPRVKRNNPKSSTCQICGHWVGVCTCTKGGISRRQPPAHRQNSSIDLTNLTLSAHSKPRKSSGCSSCFIIILILIAIIGYGIYQIYDYRNGIGNWFGNTTETVSEKVSGWFDNSVKLFGEDIGNWFDNSTETAKKQLSDLSSPTTQSPTTPNIILKPTPQTATYTPPITKSFDTMFSEYRASFGLSPLQFTDDLNKIAKLRLTEIQANYNHNSIGNYNKHLAENINWISSGYLSDARALDSWISSSGHRANILNPSYKYTGYANGGGYAVQVFSSYPTINGEPQLPSGWYWKE